MHHPRILLGWEATQALGILAHGLFFKYTNSRPFIANCIILGDYSNWLSDIIGDHVILTMTAIML